MIPAEFDYVAPGSLDEALSALRDGGEDAKVLAGGHSLIPLMKLRLAAPSLLVDLRRCRAWPASSARTATVRIGAMTTPPRRRGRRTSGLASQAAGTIADQQVRNRGTIGGSLAHGDPASDMPAILLAYEGSVTIRGEGGEREVAAADLFQDYLTTAVGDGEILTEVRLPALDGYGLRLPQVQPPPGGLGDGRRVARWSRRRRTARARTCGSASRTSASTPLRATAVEEALRGQPLDAERSPRRPSRPPRAPSRPPTSTPRPTTSATSRACCAGARWRTRHHEAVRFTTTEDVSRALAGEGYLADRALATAVYLAAALEQPLLLEGEAGVGKTEVARALALGRGRAADPPAVPRGDRPPPRGLRLGLPAPAARDPRRRGGRRARASCSGASSCSGGRCWRRSSTTARRCC